MLEGVMMAGMGGEVRIQMPLHNCVHHTGIQERIKSLRKCRQMQEVGASTTGLAGFVFNLRKKGQRLVVRQRYEEGIRKKGI